jgi:hypothetical protein
MGDLSRDSYTSVLQLLDMTLSDHAFAQVTAIMSMEAGISRASGWRKDQGRDDYYFVVHGDPTRDGLWHWRFEGHHISITASIAGTRVYLTPIFLGACPDITRYAGTTIMRPLAAEGELARAALSDMGRDCRHECHLSSTAPKEIQYGSAGAMRVPHPRVPSPDFPASSRGILRELAACYLDRTTPEFAEAKVAAINNDDIHFSWAGGLESGDEFHYRLQVGTWLIAEYGNNKHGERTANHVHSVLRLPEEDFGGDDALGL